MPRGNNLDGQVGVRLELATLATLAKYYYGKRELAALKSASMLVRYALNDLSTILQQYERAEVVNAASAIEVLEDLGVFPRISRSAHMKNVQEETMMSEPHSRLKQWDSTKQSRETQPQHVNNSKLQYSDEAVIKQEIERALQDNRLQNVLAHKRLTDDNSSPDEGEFCPDIAHDQLMGEQ